MRLWHQDLIPYLDRQRLLGQHRECCALRGRGWGKKHSVVDYVFRYDLAHLYAYHFEVMAEMGRRGYGPDPRWYEKTYCGRSLGYAKLEDVGTWCWDCAGPVYTEHDDAYMAECLLNLRMKNAELENGVSVSEMLFRLYARNPDLEIRFKRKGIEND